MLFLSKYCVANAAGLWLLQRENAEDKTNSRYEEAEVLTRRSLLQTSWCGSFLEL